MTEKKELKQVVTKVLEKSERARANDMYLYLRVFLEMGWSTDLEDHVDNPINKFDSISRLRRKAQETNPLLRPKEQTTANRKAREEKYKELPRGL